MNRFRTVFDHTIKTSKNVFNQIVFNQIIFTRNMFNQNRFCSACQDARFDMALLAALPSKGRVFMYCNDYSTWRDIEHGLRRRRHGVTDMGPFRAQKL